MDNLFPAIPAPHNEPVYPYLPDSPETVSLKKQLKEFLSSEVEVPVIINGKPVHTGRTAPIYAPHDRRRKLGIYHQAGPKEVAAAIDGSLAAALDWARLPADERAAIFLKAAELLTTRYRQILNASTMLGQSKTCHQAEIDAACEMIDFFRFNVHFQQEIYKIQPLSLPNVWNRVEYRPLEGFVFAVTPFNFTSIGGNLPTSPAVMGNVVLWKPSSTAIFSNFYLMKLLEEAGIPPGVIQFLPGEGAEIGNPVIAHKSFAGIHFTGSTKTFNSIWGSIGANLGNYRSYPRIVGETGGKDFIFAHASAEVQSLATAIVRGAFEYQGQKCSAASRVYIPRSLWPQVSERIVADVKSIKMGDVLDFKNFMGAVIDKKSFDKIRSYIEAAKKSPDAKILVGGGSDDSVGYFIEPTVIEVSNPEYVTMKEEIFGPVISIYVYEDLKLEETLDLCDTTSPYALTGAVFAKDRKVIRHVSDRLRNTAGNFYINNKPTGAVVGQQPFGGARASGTNDKAGSLFNLTRWTSLRTISETFVPPTDYRYPFLRDNG
jgi:1-pyrroline-5-carboxylate dehydrogenase